MCFLFDLLNFPQYPFGRFISMKIANFATMKKTIMITGATGVMGYATLQELSRRLDRFNITLLARNSKKNIKKLEPFLKKEGVKIIWGDLTNPEDVEKAVEDADIVLHIGGMVSPLADHHPKKALKVNVEGARNIVEAIKKQPVESQAALVYIGSVAQTSDRRAPLHWSRTGDPILVSVFDYYGLSKVLAERIVAESGLKKWVSLRQSGILHPGLFLKSNDPITFHVPLKGVLEWTTLEDSGRLMANICEEGVPETFWNRFYNIGSGKAYRLTNYEFEKLILKGAGTPPPEKIFDTDWFATRNFHGSWFADSDKLEELVPFRENLPVEDYFQRMMKSTPWWIKLAPLAPPFVVKSMMKKVAHTSGLGTLDWRRRSDREQHIEAFFGSREAIANIPDWEHQDLSRPSEKPVMLDHGYDETKPDDQLTISDMHRAAAFRGGKCLSVTMQDAFEAILEIAGGEKDVSGKKDMSQSESKIDIHKPLEWECAFGHRFKATPNLILKGGHWCPHCLPAPWRYNEEAAHNPFLAQVWHSTHSPEETTIYDDGALKN